MKKTTAAVALAFGTVLVPQVANAQTGEEIRGQTVQVQFPDGTVNTVNFGADGSAMITGADGNTVSGNWFVENRQICLQTAAARECWPYTTAFQAGVPMQLASQCGPSTWTALSTNMPPPPPTPERGGERG